MHGSWTEQNFVSCFFIPFKLLDKSINLIESNHYWNVFHYILQFEQWVYFVGKGKKGLRLSIYRKPSTYVSKNEKPMTTALHAFSSPSYSPDGKKKVAGYHLRPGILKVSIMCSSPLQRMWTILRDITASLC